MFENGEYRQQKSFVKYRHYDILETNNKKNKNRIRNKIANKSKKRNRNK